MNSDLYERYVTDLKLKGYAKRSRQSYRRSLRQFQHFTSKAFEDMTEEDLRGYWLCCKEELGWSSATLRISYSAIKHFFSNIVKRDWEVLRKYAGFEFDDDAPKNEARLKYDNMLYLERPGCNLCMGNQEKAEKGDTVMATSTRLFQGRVVEDSDAKKGESLLASTPVVVLSSILGRTPNIDEYVAAVDGINLTDYAPPQQH